MEYELSEDLVVLEIGDLASAVRDLAIFLDDDNPTLGDDTESLQLDVDQAIN